MDGKKLCSELCDKQTIKIEDINLGLIHGSGNPNKLISYINKAFLKNWEKIDIFIFGHSHYPLDKKIEEKIFFNPGSPTDKIFAPYRSYGILEINGKNLKRRIVKIE
jgi:hypothetical protein